jgi:hypothetical protein
MSTTASSEALNEVEIRPHTEIPEKTFQHLTPDWDERMNVEDAFYRFV